MSETFKPTESMAANAKRALKWKEEGKAGSAGTSVGWARANQLARREALTLDTVKRMYSFFSRHEVDKKGKDWDKPSNGKIMWYAWGGDSGYSWSRAIVNRAKGEVKKDLAINLIDDLMELTKAIGTSSSANEERDERTVENYVRQSANTNLNNLQTGGNIVSNTTEPDPQGEIAITKSIPDGTKGPLIGQETRPTDGATSVAPAPNGDNAVVPDQATIPSSATSAIAPTSAEMAEAAKVTIAKGEKCPTCGAVAKADDADEDDTKVEKAAACKDCGKEMDMCMCKVEKAADAEAKEEPKKEEVKKSIWGGAFAPVK